MVLYGLKETEALKADLAETEDFVEIELTAVNGTDEIHVHRTTKDQLCTNGIQHSGLGKKREILRCTRHSIQIVSSPFPN